jgi:hypothetical protein
MTTNTCGCNNIIGPLKEDDQLPDHVCGRTARITCRKWVADTRNILRAPQSGKWKSVVVPIDSRVAVCRIRANPNYRQNLVQEGFGYELATVDPGNDTWDIDWPIPVKDCASSVCIVLRTTVEDPPDKELIRVLEDLDAWRLALNDVVSAVLPVLKPGQNPQAKNDYLPTAVALFHSHIALRRYALPPTWSTAQYLAARAFFQATSPDPRDPNPTTMASVLGDLNAYPSRGLTIVSMVLVPNSVGHGDVVSQVVSSSLWAGDAWARVGPIITKYSRWAKEVFPFIPDTSLRKYGRRRADDELNRDVDRVLANEMSEDDYLQRAIDRTIERCSSLGKRPSSSQISDARDQAQKRLKYQKNKS